MEFTRVDENTVAIKSDRLSGNYAEYNESEKILKLSFAETGFPNANKKASEFSKKINDKYGENSSRDQEGIVYINDAVAISSMTLFILDEFADKDSGIYKALPKCTTEEHIKCTTDFMRHVHNNIAAKVAN